jgi:hypothetical protein
VIVSELKKDDPIILALSVSTSMIQKHIPDGDLDTMTAELAPVLCTATWLGEEDRDDDHLSAGSAAWTVETVPLSGRNLKFP